MESKIFTCVVELSAVVGRREECHQLAFCEEFVAILDHLMGTANQVEVVLSQEFCDNLKWNQNMLIKGPSERGTLMSHTSAPNVKLTPRSFSPHPIVSLSGSDHNKSHKSPWSGTSVGRMMRRICSIDWRSGLRPPWQQKIFSSTEKRKQ